MTELCYDTICSLVWQVERQLQSSVRRTSAPFMTRSSSQGTVHVSSHGNRPPTTAGPSYASSDEDSDIESEGNGTDVGAGSSACAWVTMG